MLRKQLMNGLLSASLLLLAGCAPLMLGAAPLANTDTDTEIETELVALTEETIDDVAPLMAKLPVTFPYQQPMGFTLTHHEGEVFYINPFAQSLKIEARRISDDPDRVALFLDTLADPTSNFREILADNREHVTITQGSNWVNVLMPEGDTVDYWHNQRLFTYGQHLYEVTLWANLQELAAGMAALDAMLN